MKYNKYTVSNLEELTNFANLIMIVASGMGYVELIKEFIIKKGTNVALSQLNLVALTKTGVEAMSTELKIDMSSMGIITPMLKTSSLVDPLESEMIQLTPELQKVINTLREKKGLLKDVQSMLNLEIDVELTIETILYLTLLSKGINLGKEVTLDFIDSGRKLVEFLLLDKLVSIGGLLEVPVNSIKEDEQEMYYDTLETSIMYANCLHECLCLPNKY